MIQINNYLAIKDAKLYQMPGKHLTYNTGYSMCMIHSYMVYKPNW